ncbi:putative tRNA (uracil-O(2)-)-methyltransferase [Pseudolycoriella hygida]|uniref:tRNA (uracil-O(2)-)-methyltransferase n=1 Tax=Pseudolycoriella hygida TaxID=35572 RepID=A0A9Q0MKD9_9DIPT|nr:putative tRNA (uracil-O(2)-)-methyltransferase [Pseudolycoriella hygida]
MNRIDRICYSPVKKPQNFWRVAKLYLEKPHTVNKRLAGTVPLSFFKSTNEISLETFMELRNYLRNETEYNGDRVIEFFKGNQIDAFKCPAVLLDDLVSASDNEDVVLNHNRIIIVRKMLPKNKNLYENVSELVLIDFTSKSASFTTIDAADGVSPFSYRVMLTSDNLISIEVIGDESNSKVCTWIKHCLLPKLVKWHDQELGADSQGMVSNVESLSLVNIEEYNDLYNQLKAKYGLEMVKIWPESTDPSKFVYEDVAIATYLLLIWRQERIKNKTTKLQSFVDLGCGNGLLVYILSSEGHPGYGVDIRKRGIWDLYPKTTILKIETVIPSNKTNFPDIDWIIGNHSDELSAWLPVMACRNSFKTNFFVLPCCPFEFDGTKYQRKNCQISQYQDFLEYMVQISSVCGFDTKVDRLKIPSTKRCAIIGIERTWMEDEFNKRCKDVERFIEERTKPVACDDSWNINFTPRESVEKVQNCTKVDRNVQQKIVKLIFDHLLLKKRYINDFVNNQWNFGGIAALSDLAPLIPAELLKELKSECGGLQTLLRNNHQIFQVQKGKVQIRRPLSQNERRSEPPNQKAKPFIFKQKECWFRCFHPDGCPFSDEDCTFKH